MRCDVLHRNRGATAAIVRRKQAGLLGLARRGHNALEPQIHGHVAVLIRWSAGSGASPTQSTTIRIPIDNLEKPDILFL
jgi:hypothetical protein